MKKLLGILVLGLVLTFSSNGISGEMNLWKKKIKLPEDMIQGYKNVWNFCCNFDPETRLTPDYAFKFVNKTEGHPVRLGEQSVRFELRRGDCGVSPGGYDDCAIKFADTGMTSERHELSLDPKVSPFKKITWNTYSIFLPEDFPLLDPHFMPAGHITMGQLHGDGDGAVGFQWDIGKGGGYVVNRRTGCFLPENKKKRCSVSNPQNNTQEVIPKDKLLGKWHDIVLNVNWTKKQNGYLKQWINGKLVYHYQGNTDTPREKEQFQMGIYRGPLPSTPKNLTQIAYFDQVRFAKSCDQLKLEDLGYSCSDLETQTIPEIDKMITAKMIKSMKLSLTGKYQLKWVWVDKNTKTNKVIKKRTIVTDIVSIKKGKVTFDKLGSSKVISDKYRKKVKFVQSGKEEIIVQGELDLDTKSTDFVKIILKPDPDNKQNYIGIGEIFKDSNKDKSENIKLIIVSMN